MKFDNRQYWDEDDYEIESEFEDVADVLHSAMESVPNVPGRLDRIIRERAKFQSGRELTQNWFFSRAPQLALAALLLFSIGVYFVMGLEQFDLARHRQESTQGPMRSLTNERTMNVPREAANADEVGDLNAGDLNAGEWNRGVSNLSGLDEVTRESIRVSSGHSWVKLRFKVNDSGRVQEIMVIESCAKAGVLAHCVDDDVHDDYAIRQVMGNTYVESGEMEEIIFIPPEYVTTQQ